MQDVFEIEEYPKKEVPFAYRAQVLHHFYTLGLFFKDLDQDVSKIDGDIMFHILGIADFARDFPAESLPSCLKDYEKSLAASTITSLDPRNDV